MAVRAKPRSQRRRLDLAARRRELFRLASPVFDRLGYREVTLKDLARACHLSAASLYYYFPSKLDFALYPFTIEGQGCEEFEARLGRSSDPLLAILEWMDYAISMIPTMELARRMAAEAERMDVPARTWRTAVGRWRRVLGEMARLAAPQLDDEAVAELADALNTILSGSMGRVTADATVLRSQLCSLLRGYLVPAGLDPARFDAIFR